MTSVSNDETRIEIIDGASKPDIRDKLLELHRMSCEANGIRYDHSEHDGSIIAMADASPVGLIEYDVKDGYRIKVLHTTADAPESTVETMMRSVKALAIYNGIDSISIHSVDNNGRTNDSCLNMGFGYVSDCPCCQREGALCLRMNF